VTSQIDTTKPIFGTPTTQSVRDNFTTAANEITALQNQTSGSPFLSLAGGRMTGTMYLFNDPTDAMMPATKGYVDAHSGSGGGGIPEAPTDGKAYGRESGAWVPVLPLAGGTLTGALILAADPTALLGAVTKQYSDANVANGIATRVLKTGDTMTGPLVLPGSPTATLQAATKDYVDTSISSAVSAAPYLPIAGGTLTGPLRVGGLAVPSNAFGPQPSFYQVLLGTGTLPGLFWNMYETTTAQYLRVASGYAAQIRIDNSTGALLFAVHPTGAAGTTPSTSVGVTFEQSGLFTVPGLNANTATITTATINTLTVSTTFSSPSSTRIGTISALSPTQALLTVENNGGTAAQFMSSYNGPGAVAMAVRSDRTDGSAIQFLWGASTAAGSIVIGPSGVVYNTTSDYRLKRIIGPTDGALIADIPIYLGEFLEVPGVQRPMLLAHELQPIAPWAVSGARDAMTKDGNVSPQMVDFLALIPALIAYAQSIAKRVTTLEAKP
jgi:hypothetical protein